MPYLSASAVVIHYEEALAHYIKCMHLYLTFTLYTGIVPNSLDHLDLFSNLYTGLQLINIY